MTSLNWIYLKTALIWKSSWEKRTVIQWSRKIRTTQNVSFYWTKSILHLYIIRRCLKILKCGKYRGSLKGKRELSQLETWIKQFRVSRPVLTSEKVSSMILIYWKYLSIEYVSSINWSTSSAVIKSWARCSLWLGNSLYIQLGEIFTAMF